MQSGVDRHAGCNAFGVEHHGNPMQDRGDAHRGEDLFFGKAFVTKDLLVRVYAGSAAVDGRNGDAPKLKIELLNSVVRITFMRSPARMVPYFSLELM